jgi:tripartite-type tricarboxylate transporter receptor subunit TctC
MNRRGGKAMSRLRGAARSAVALAGALILASAPVFADPVADFYRGRQIRFVIRTPPGGDYDQYTRLFARFMGKHIPGEPSMIPVNMPGGGGIVAANYMAQIAPHDGTVIGIISQGLATDQALGMSPQLKADLREFNWIANIVYSPQLLVVWHTSATKNLEDAKHRETTIGTTGAGSASVQYPAFFNNVLGTKFKIVFGYPGGQAIDLALERGEVEGRGINPYSGYMASKPTWIPEKLIIPLIQVGLAKEPAISNVPLLLDQPVKPEDKPLLEFMSRAATVGRPLATTPGVPADRVAALRDAFAATIKDPEFIAAAKYEHLDIAPMSADKLAEIIAGLLNAPQDVRDRAKAALEPKTEHTIKVR